MNGQEQHPQASRWLPGELHPRWRGGYTITAKGYVRLKSGKHRDKYEHRAAMEDLMGCAIPPGFEVHHFDRDRTHNCPFCNLMLLDERIHHAIEKAQRELLPWYEKHKRKLKRREAK